MEKSASDRLLELLKARLRSPAGSSPSPVPDPSPVSRRAFLVSAGAVGGGLLATAPAARAEGLRIDWLGRALQVSLGGRRWTLDPEVFAAGARVFHVKHRDTHTLRLVDAFLAGTSARLDLTATLSRRRGDWLMSLDAPALGVAGNIRLEEWLAGTAVHGAPGPWKTRLGQRMGLAGESCRLALDAGWRLEVCAQGQPLTVTPLGRTPFERVELRPEALSELDATALGTAPGRPGAIAMLEGKQKLPALRCGNRASMGCFRPEADARAHIVASAGSASAGRAALRVEGGGELSVSSSSELLRLERAVATLGPAAGARRLAVAGHIAEGSAVQMGSAWTLIGPGEEPVAAVFESGTPATVSASACLRQQILRIADADYATVYYPADCENPPIPITLDQQPPRDSIPLDHATLRLGRGKDFFALDFHLNGYALQFTNGYPELQAVKDDTTLAVIFPPQHIAEAHCTTANPAPSCPKVPFASRAAGTSTIVFEIPRGELDGQLTIGRLTENWARWPMKVDARAKDALGTDLGNQLKAADIKEDDKKENADWKIRKLLVPPSGTTALELHSRLIFSPSEQARWLVPSKPADGKRQTIWRARLDGHGERTMRALWSRRLTAWTFGVSNDADRDQLSSLTAKNHWDIVGQTSVYGLAATRGDDSRVVPPPNNYKHPGAELLGIALAIPFERATVELTSLGANVEALWRGRPPMLADIENEPRNYKYDLEKLFIETHLGRDIKVESVEKGYLLPLGIPSSLVTLTERQVTALGSRPVATLVKRTFITIQKPEKTFPAINQPFDGREFVPGQCRMVTLVTPDLTGADGTHFWPTDTAGKPVRFKWTLDGDPTPCESELLFVKFSAVGTPKDLENAVTTYRAAGTEAANRRKVTMGGARRRYAPSDRDGETSFDTVSWELGISGRIDGDKENFTFDAHMNGADQPPCYPVINTATIAIQSAERLVGRTLGNFKVAFTDKYKRHGFGPDNKGEIYLEVLEPQVTLDFGGNGANAGGLATPTGYLAALSRKSGLVGAKPKTTISAPSRFDIAGAEAGGFDPSSFFSDAKLLGIVPLGEVVKAASDLADAPRLLQTYLYGVGTGLSLEAVQAAAAIAQEKARAAFSRLDEEIEKDRNGQSIAAQYPSLKSSVESRRKEIDGALARIGRSTDLASAMAEGTTAVTAAKAFLADLDRVRRNPLPADVAALVKDASALWQALGAWEEPVTIRLPSDATNLVNSCASFPLSLLGLEANPTLKSLETAADRALFAEQLAKPLREIAAAAQMPITNLPDLLGTAQRMLISSSRLQAFLDALEAAKEASFGNWNREFANTLTKIAYDAITEGDSDLAKALRGLVRELSGLKDSGEVRRALRTIQAVARRLKRIAALKAQSPQATLEIAARLLEERRQLAYEIGDFAEAVSNVLDGNGINNSREIDIHILAIEKTLEHCLVKPDFYIPLLTALPSLPQQMNAELESIQSRLKAARDGLNTAAIRDPVTRKAAISAIRTVADLDKKLAALLLQFNTVIPPDFLTNLKRFVTATTDAVIGAVKTPHLKVVNTARQVFPKDQDDPRSQLVMRLIGKTQRSELSTLVAEASSEDAALQSIPTQPVLETPPIPAWINTGPALLRFSGKARTAMTQLLDGGLERVLRETLRNEIAAVEEALRELLSQFVPTAVKLEYSFKSSLKEFPSGDDYVFRMKDGINNDDDLEIKSVIDVDLTTGERRTEAIGKLRPFEIQLLGKAFDIATVTFGAADFTLPGSGAMKFDLKVTDVKIGKLLEFLQPLQEWLAPSGSGFYITPISGRPGLEAGYNFAGDVIQIGSVQFINVAFGVATRLFFDGSDAEFAFRLSSPSQPFLIASPPYGGGGYVSLIANARGIKAFELSFVMGAVTAIKFGPLRGYGRVTAGFILAVEGDRRELCAVVEAMGHGSVAFFSVTVALRVLLRQQTIGDRSSMDGTATYSFRFRLGFVRYRYSVKARYTLQGGKSGRDTAANNAIPLIAPPFALAATAAVAVSAATVRRPACRVDAPAKHRDWRRYRNECLDMDLLER